MGYFLSDNSRHPSADIPRIGVLFLIFLSSLTAEVPMEKKPGLRPPLPPADEGTQLIDDVGNTVPAAPPKVEKVERTMPVADQEDAAAAFLSDLEATHAEPGAAAKQALEQTEPVANAVGQP